MRCALRAAAAGLALLAAGCSPVGPNMSAWTGTFEPAAGVSDAPEGTVGAVSRGIATTATVAIHGAPPGSVYLWRLRQGSCGRPGALVGGRASYPELVADARGVAVGDARLSETMDAAGAYQASLLSGSGSDTVLVACTALEPA